MRACVLNRPGRLDKLLYVPLPPAAGRVAILRALARRTPLAPDVDLAAVGGGPRTEGYSGADLAALVREAAVASLKVRCAARFINPARGATAAPTWPRLCARRPSRRSRCARCRPCNGRCFM